MRVQRETFKQTVEMGYVRGPAVNPVSGLPAVFSHAVPPRPVFKDAGDTEATDDKYIVVTYTPEREQYRADKNHILAWLPGVAEELRTFATNGIC